MPEAPRQIRKFPSAILLAALGASLAACSGGDFGRTRADMTSLARVLSVLSGLAAIAALAGPAVAADSPTLAKIKSSGAITIGHREASIPFSYLGPDQKPIGFSLDLCAGIVERIKTELNLPNLGVNYAPVNSSNRIPLIQSGTVDIECGGTANDRKRQEQVSFSVATFVSQPRWLVKADSGLKTARDLKGKTIVVTQGSNAVGFAQGVNAKEQLGFNIVQAKDHALEGWSDCLRLELAPFGIKVVVVEPGLIETGFGDVVANGLLKRSGGGPYAKLTQAVAKSTRAAYGQGRGTNPSVIAGVVSRAVKEPKPRTRYVAGKYALPMKVE